MDRRLGVLIGQSTNIMEMEDDEQEDRVEQAEKNYDFFTLLDNIKSKDFKSVYLVLIDSIKEKSFEDQRVLCRRILDNLYELFDFEFNQEVSLDNLNDCKEVYYLLEFLSFDFSFFASILIKNILQYENYDLINKKDSIFEVLNSEHFTDCLDKTNNEVSNLPKLVKIFLLESQIDVIKRFLRRCFIMSKQEIIQNIYLNEKEKI